MTREPATAVVPVAHRIIEDAVAAAGARSAPPEEAEAIIWTDPLDAAGLAAVLARSPARWVQLPFAGVERFVAAGVIDAARTWTCAKGIYGPATAEHALALMLAAARRIHNHARARSWHEPVARHRRMLGTTAVLVGTGGIGRALLPMLSPLGVRVIAVNRSGAPLAGADRTVTSASLAEVAPAADWMVVAAALTPETTGIIDREMLGRMTPDAWLVNVARGGLVDTDALVEALEAGTVGGAALDVTEPEPLPPDHPLWRLDNVIVTPHVANTTEMALPELAALVRRNVRRFAAGEPLEGLVDPRLGY